MNKFFLAALSCFVMMLGACSDKNTPEPQPNPDPAFKQSKMCRSPTMLLPSADRAHWYKTVCDCLSAYGIASITSKSFQTATAMCCASPSISTIS